MSTCLTQNETVDEIDNDYSSHTIKEYNTFDSMGIDDTLLRGIYAHGFEHPSMIQQKAIVPFSSGRDILAQSQSGTGKTATFLIGSLMQVTNDYTEHPKVLIITPTRELALQIKSVSDALSSYKKINSIALIGGTSVHIDIKSLRNDVNHIAIGTPGRVLHLLTKKYLHLSELKCVILDEVDEMLSVGFEQSIRDIFDFVSNDCQVAMFSATMSESTKVVARKILNNPLQIFVKNDEVTLEGISQFYINVQKEDWKFPTLLDIYDKLSISQTIIYINSKKKADWLQEQLQKESHTVSCLHGDMSQQERNSVLNDYRAGISRILIATDIISRGIDIQQVSIVINYDLPIQKETYIHRIGRSGRFGRKGVAINLITYYDKQKLKNIEEFYNTEIAEMPMDISDFV
tara:strand:+ start:1051 stop:2259 length:1209 start_codon:yes stop_codon:yes gene_type:complete